MLSNCTIHFSRGAPFPLPHEFDLADLDLACSSHSVLVLILTEATGKKTHKVAPDVSYKATVFLVK